MGFVGKLKVIRELMVVFEKIVMRKVVGEFMRQSNFGVESVEVINVRMMSIQCRKINLTVVNVIMSDRDEMFRRVKMEVCTLYSSTRDHLRRSKR